MKILIHITILILLFVQSTAAAELTADEIVEKVNDVMMVDQMKAKIKMTIITTSDQERSFVYTFFSKNSGEKTLIRYLEPRRVKDQATLMLNNADDIWSYFPRTKRVRKLATHAKRQKMQGSDFSYEDMGSGDTFIKDYDSQRRNDEEKEGFECYKLELTRKQDSDAGYSRLIVWARKTDFLPVTIDYYDDENPDILTKELVQSNFKTIQNQPTAMNWIMYDKQDDTYTKMELLEVDYNVDLDDDMFTERALKK
jgi:outer membrane lipoprotein-sorting protein